LLARVSVIQWDIVGSVFSLAVGGEVGLIRREL
jgi:hypothetical protein